MISKTIIRLTIIITVIITTIVVVSNLDKLHQAQITYHNITNTKQPK